MPIFATAIDLTNFATYGFSGLATLRSPLWTSGGNLYAAGTLLHSSPAFERAGVWKSVDDGNTWTLMDDGNAPEHTASLANCIEGAVVYFLCGSRSDEADVPMRLHSFNCATDTWSLIDDTGPDGHWASGLHKRSDGSFAVLFGTDAGNLYSVAYSGSWSSPEDIGIAVGDTNLEPEDVWSVMDSTDRTHVFFHGPRNGVTFVFDDVWHVAVEADDTLGSIDVLPALDNFGGAVVVGTQVAIGVGENDELKVLVGTPLNNPTFTLSAALDANYVEACNMIFYLGVAILVSFYNLASPIITSLQSFDLATWAAPVQLYDTATDTLPPDYDPGLGIYPVGMWQGPGSTFLIGSNYQHDTFNEFTSFYIGEFAFTSRLRNYFH